MLAAKDHLNLFLYDGLIVPDPDHIITGGHENKAARTRRRGAPALAVSVQCWCAARSPASFRQSSTVTVHHV
jgi:hypothetical protein